MQQYFYSDELKIGDLITLSEEDNHHLVNVMRGQRGDTVQIVDSYQGRFISKICRFEHKKALIEIVKLNSIFSSELPIKVTIACGLSKNDKFDWIVQKAVECGMFSFIPLVMERNVVKWDDNKARKRLDRLEKIAKEAAEQSHRLIIPEIHPLMTLSELSLNYHNYLKIVANEEEAKKGYHDNFKKTIDEAKENNLNLLMVFGSEGGISGKEIELLENSGFISCSLGPRILRAETAPIYALSSVSFHFEL